MPPKKVTPRGTAAKPVNAGPVAKKATPKAAPKKTSTSNNKYIRNIRGVSVRVTFDTGRRIQLDPRGQRNDMTAINKAELDDPIFLNNLGTLYEVISSADASIVREKQSTNASSLGHPRPEQILTDHLGNPGNFVGLEASDADKSITIGHLNETEGKNNEEKSIEVTRGVQPQRVDVPGSVDNSQLAQYGNAVSVSPLPPISERE